MEPQERDPTFMTAVFDVRPNLLTRIAHGFPQPVGFFVECLYLLALGIAILFGWSLYIVFRPIPLLSFGANLLVGAFWLLYQWAILYAYAIFFAINVASMKKGQVLYFPVDPIYEKSILSIGAYALFLLLLVLVRAIQAGIHPMEKIPPADRPPPRRPVPRHDYDLSARPGWPIWYRFTSQRSVVAVFFEPLTAVLIGFAFIQFTMTYALGLYFLAATVPYFLYNAQKEWKVVRYRANLTDSAKEAYILANNADLDHYGLTYDERPTVARRKRRD